MHAISYSTSCEKEAGGFFWATLVNRYGNSGWIQIQNGASFQGGLFKRSDPISLAFTPSIKGYVCLLMPEGGGRVTVLYPNGRTPINKQVAAFEQYDLSRFAAVDLNASSPGPTYFVMLVSSEPRTLDSFEPPNFITTFVDEKGKVVSGSQIGPGVNGATDPLPPKTRGADLLPADSWDVAHLNFDVGN